MGDVPMVPCAACGQPAMAKRPDEPLGEQMFRTFPPSPFDGVCEACQKRAVVWAAKQALRARNEGPGRYYRPALPDDCQKCGELVCQCAGDIASRCLGCGADPGAPHLDDCRIMAENRERNEVLRNRKAFYSSLTRDEFLAAIGEKQQKRPVHLCDAKWGSACGFHGKHDIRTVDRKQVTCEECLLKMERAASETARADKHAKKERALTQAIEIAKQFEAARAEPDHCPDCGAGRNADGTFTISKGYPFAAPCAACERRTKERMEELGRRMALEREQRYLDAIARAQDVAVEDGVTIEFESVCSVCGVIREGEDHKPGCWIAERMRERELRSIVADSGVGCRYCQVLDGMEHDANCPARQPFADFKGTLESHHPSDSTIARRFLPGKGAGVDKIMGVAPAKTWHFGVMRRDGVAERFQPVCCAADGVNVTSTESKVTCPKCLECIAATTAPVIVEDSMVCCWCGSAASKSEWYANRGGKWWCPTCVHVAPPETSDQDGVETPVITSTAATTLQTGAELKIEARKCFGCGGNDGGLFRAFGKLWCSDACRAKYRDHETPVIVDGGK